MKRKLVLIAASLLAEVFIFTSALASPLPVFGPRKYRIDEEGTGKFIEAFSICNPSGTYRISAEKGHEERWEGDGDSDSDSGAAEIEINVEINGDKIIKEKDFDGGKNRAAKDAELEGTNIIEIKIEGEPGGYALLSVECVSNCFDVEIDTPTDGETMSRPAALIEGSLVHTSGEAGVVIRSQTAEGEARALAQVQADGFAASIPLQAGKNIIVAAAADACGDKASDTVILNRDSFRDFIMLTASPASGVLSADTGAMAVHLEAEAFLAGPPSYYSWDLSGDGTYDREGSDLSGVTVSYQIEGLYYPTVTITDTEGNLHTESTIVSVLPWEEMDSLLRGKWEGMKGELGSGNMDAALKYIAYPSRDMYRYNFELMSSILPAIAQDMGEITFVRMSGDLAEYEMIAAQEGREYSFYVEFVKDDDGIWRIRFY